MHVGIRFVRFSYYRRRSWRIVGRHLCNAGGIEIYIDDKKAPSIGGLGDVLSKVLLEPTKLLCEHNQHLVLDLWPAT